MIIVHGFHILASCFPNCHPAGYTGGALKDSGNAALGAVVFLLGGVGAWKLLTRKSGGKK